MKVVLVDDHPLVVKGLMAVLEEDGMVVLGNASNKSEAQKLVAGKNPDMVIVDLRLGSESGFDFIEEMRELGHTCKFVVLTSSLDLNDFRKANELSVDGYISKEALPEEFMTAIRTIKKGRRFFDPEMVEKYMLQDQKSVLDDLTDREYEVLVCLGKGLNNKDIAQKLFVTEHTVKKHVGQIFNKLGLTDRTQAAIFALNNGLIAE